MLILYLQGKTLFGLEVGCLAEEAGTEVIMKYTDNVRVTRVSGGTQSTMLGDSYSSPLRLLGCSFLKGAGQGAGIRD